MLMGVLNGEPGAPSDIVALNAGAALYAANLTDSLQGGLALARAALHAAWHSQLSSGKVGLGEGAGVAGEGSLERRRGGRRVPLSWG
jgi:hypothetical protein